MTKPQVILDRLSAWVEKQSSVGPAAFKGMREEIEREVGKEALASWQVAGIHVVDGEFAPLVEGQGDRALGAAMRGRADGVYELVIHARKVREIDATDRERLERWKNHTATQGPTKVFDQQEEDAKLKEALEGLSDESAIALLEKWPPGEIIRQHELWKWLSEAAKRVISPEEPKTAAEGVVEQLAKEMGEFARDEMDTAASDVDELLRKALSGLSKESIERLGGMGPEQIIRAHQIWQWLNQVVVAEEPAAADAVAQGKEAEAALDFVAKRHSEAWRRLAEIDARDREAQAMDQAKSLSLFCDEHGIDLELVLRSIYP